MAQRNESVFQLSLTEIAFTIAFILLLLLGYLVFKEQTARIEAENQLAGITSAERAAAALDAAKVSLSQTLKGAGIPNPDEVVTRLVEADKLSAERDQYKQRVADLEAKLTALTELQQQLEKVARSEGDALAKHEVVEALALAAEIRKSKEGAQKVGAIERAKRDIAAAEQLRRELKEQLGLDLPNGREAEAMKRIVSAAKVSMDAAKDGSNPESVKKENSDLRGQVAFLKHRLDARGGRDFPPCWADESGKIEFLFAVETRPDGVVLAPAWPPRRESDARALPGISDVLAGPLPNHDFTSKIQGIFNWSKKQDPECRHYVQLRSSINDAIQADRARLMIENFFYKVEARR